MAVQAIVRCVGMLNTHWQEKLNCSRIYLTGKFTCVLLCIVNTEKHSTHQQARSDREDVVCRVLGGNASTGLGNVAENTAVDDGAQDEVDMADDDER